MGFKENNEHGKGRKKGSINRTTKVMKQILTSALFGDEDSIANDLAQLSPYHRLMVKAKFASYILPNLKTVEVNDITEDTTSIAYRLEQYTDEQIKFANDEYIREELAKKNK